MNKSGERQFHQFLHDLDSYFKFSVRGESIDVDYNRNIRNIGASLVAKKTLGRVLT